MKYQISLNYQFKADSESEARDKAQEYVSNHLTVRQLPEEVVSPVQIVEKCQQFRNKKKEHFCVFYLDTQNHILGREVVSVGTLNSNLVHPRECFRTAIVKTCCGIIVAHNHPSGGVEPSAEDLDVTKRLVDAGKLLGIEVLDHVIVTAASYTSFKERGLI